MKNKITFFRFKHSKVTFDPKLQMEQISNKKEFEKHKKYINKYSEKKYQNLNENQVKTLKDYSNSFENFRRYLSKEQYELLGKNPKNIKREYDLYYYKKPELYVLNPKQNDNSIKKEFYNKIKTEFNLDELTELFLQKEYNNNYELYKKHKELVENCDIHERIEIQDLTELNKTVEDMNKDGWRIKQTEGIQSGESHRWSEGGYGYSFTEGIIIVWEK